MLGPQAFVFPVKGWVESAYAPKQQQGPVYHIPLPTCAGSLNWSAQNEAIFRTREPKVMVPRPNKEKLGIDRVIHFKDGDSDRRIPWNSGLRKEMEAGYHSYDYWQKVQQTK